MQCINIECVSGVVHLQWLSQNKHSRCKEKHEKLSHAIQKPTIKKFIVIIKRSVDKNAIGVFSILASDPLVGLTDFSSI